MSEFANSAGVLDISAAARDHRAAALCYTVVRPEKDELFIDIDDAHSLLVYEDVKRLLAHAGLTIIEKSRCPSPSGREGRWHIVALLGDCPAEHHACSKVLRSRSLTSKPALRIALQAILGSDRRREALSFVRWLTHVEDPTVFFEKKPDHVHVAPAQVVLRAAQRWTRRAISLVSGGL